MADQQANQPVTTLSLAERMAALRAKQAACDL